MDWLLDPLVCYSEVLQMWLEYFSITISVLYSCLSPLLLPPIRFVCCCCCCLLSLLSKFGLLFCCIHSELWGFFFCSIQLFFIMVLCKSLLAGSVAFSQFLGGFSFLVTACMVVGTGECKTLSTGFCYLILVSVNWLLSRFNWLDYLVNGSMLPLYLLSINFEISKKKKDSFPFSIFSFSNGFPVQSHK